VIFISREPSNLQSNPDVSRHARSINWLRLFPIRYYLCAFIIAYFASVNIGYIVEQEESALKYLFQFLNISYAQIDDTVYVGNFASSTVVNIPIHAQLIFLIFFPTMAISARMHIIKRMQFLGFGALCLAAFILIEFLIVMIPFYLESPIRFLVGMLVTLVVGGLIIELSLWTMITIPTPTKVRRAVSRSYAKEYSYLIIVLAASAAVTLYLVFFLRMTVTDPVFIYGIFTISSISTISLLISNLGFEMTRRKMSNPIERSTYQESNKLAISFLLPAYNEEKMIGKCIDSIDMAASNYEGKTEIIVVNDGSTDNTEKIAREHLSSLRYASGKIFTIPNSGKGFALEFGLKQISGDIVFRMDSDSLIDKNGISLIMPHFDDPIVGSVSAFLFPSEAKTALGKAQNVLYASYLYVKRAQELFDSIIVQPGPSTAFRKEALLKIGGWTTNQFGEDGEMSSRIARFGYRSEFEQSAVVYSDLPQDMKGFVQQRARWSIAYYHSRGRNLHQAREFATPRVWLFLQNLESHGAGFGLNLAPVLIAAALLAGDTSFFFANHTEWFTLLLAVVIKLAAVHLIVTGIQLVLFAYRLDKMGRLGDIWYYPVTRFLNILISMWVKPLATEAALSWSSKWNKYDNKAFSDLRVYMHKSIDPNYPPGIVHKSKKASVSTNSIADAE